MTSLEPDIFSSSAHILHTTAKQVISRRGKEKKCCKVRVQNWKTLVQNHSWFFGVKYANVSLSFHPRTRGCFSSLSCDFTLNLSLIDRLDFFLLFNGFFFKSLIGRVRDSNSAVLCLGYSVYPRHHFTWSQRWSWVLSPTFLGTTCTSTGL